MCISTRLPILHETLLSYDIKTRELLAINEDVYTSLTNYLSKEDISKTAQPNLIVGESGSGKTFLMKRLYGRIKEDMGNVFRILLLSKVKLFSLPMTSGFNVFRNYNATSIQTQRILSALSQSNSGFTLSEIRDITRQDNGKISPYLKLMADQKLINKEAKTLRGGIYFIIDPLFKLWLRHNTAPTHKK